MRPFVICLTVFVLMPAIFWSCQATRDASLPAEGWPKFDHAGHLERDLACSDCHGGEDEAWSAMPTQEFCQECHEEIDAEQADESLRATAFFDEAGQPLWLHQGRQSDEIIFGHDNHVSEDDEGCADCHQGVMDSTSQPTATLARVSMEACEDCHSRDDEAKAYNSCESCHKELREDVAPSDHKGAWIRTHGFIARSGDYDSLPGDCARCHTRSSCQECHLAEKPQNHTNHFRLRGHGVMASMDRGSCRTCHQSDSCEACHQTSEPRSHRATWGGRFSRHCTSCHVPLQGPGDQSCSVCHRQAVTHDTATQMPGNPPHLTTNSNACRECHAPMPHPDNGQSCLLCHK